MKTINSVFFSVAIVIAAFLLANAYIQRTQYKGTIDVTGSGTIDFVSDLIVWSGSFETGNTDMKAAYEELNRQKDVIKNYLLSNGISQEEIVFEAISSGYIYEDKYSPEGKYIGQEQVGYSLTQSLTVSSYNVEKVEYVSREITELLNQGIRFYSYEPRYYYTKLAEVKMELIQKASEDAFQRADNIASNSGTKLGKLVDAKMGVFQITGQNSDEEYSWGGTFNTSSKLKTASITVKQRYSVK